jgi:hypothetical protein
MRGQGENPAPHLFCPRQAAPKLVRQFFWTIVQIFCPKNTGGVTLFLLTDFTRSRTAGSGGAEVKISPHIFCIQPSYNTLNFRGLQRTPKRKLTKNQPAKTQPLEAKQ